MRATGALGRENVGTSNHKFGESPDRRKPKGSSAMTINGGLVGPKPMANAAGDGQQVNIPALPHGFDGVTKRSMPSGLLDFRSGREECWQVNPSAAARHIPSAAKIPCRKVGEIRQSALPRKSSRVNHEATVPYTDTGGLVEYTKANG